MDGHEQSDVVEDCANFLKKKEELKPYIVEFLKNNAIKLKVYLSNYVIRGENCQPIIVITYDKCKFSANDKIQKT